MIKVSCLVSSPPALVALTVKVNVPDLVGVPEIAPVVERVNPSGNALLLSRLHVMGVSPVAASVRLYDVPTLPFVNDVVVMVGGIGGSMVMESSLVSSPTSLVALTVKVDCPSVVGVPEIAPVVERVNPSGNALPLSRLHVMGVSPVAASVWLYAVPTVPLGSDAVVIDGAVGMVTMSPGTVNEPMSVPLPTAAVGLLYRLEANTLPPVVPVEGSNIGLGGSSV